MNHDKLKDKKGFTDFVAVTKDEFFLKLKEDNYGWASIWPQDIAWREAHAKFVITKDTRETVGYKRTSSWGAPDEYFLLNEL